MDKALTALLVAISVITSGLASRLVFNYLDVRDRRIRQQLEGLENEAEYLQRIHADDRKLTRATYTTILMALCFAFLALALFVGGFALDLSASHMRYVYLGCSWLFLVSAGICFYHFRSLMRLGDFDRTWQQIQQRRVALEDRLR